MNEIQNTVIITNSMGITNHRQYFKQISDVLMKFNIKEL